MASRLNTDFMIKAVSTLQSIPPQKPTHVFFGETPGRSFFGKYLPRPQPKMNPPMSELQISRKKYRRMCPSKPWSKNTMRFDRESGTAI